MTTTTTKVQSVYNKIIEQHEDYRLAKQKAARSIMIDAAKKTWSVMKVDTAFLLMVAALGIAIIFTLFTIFLK